MRKSLIILTLLSVAFTGSAEANNSASKEELVGVGSGALIGAAAAGPFGFIVGAAFGAFIGDTMHVKNESIEELVVELDQRELSLSSAQTELTTFRAENDMLDAQVQKLSEVANPELIELMQAGIAMDLLFRTDETELSEQTTLRLSKLASALAALPDVSIQLDGFADARGDATYNLDLSARRIASIREQLVAAGIESSRIRTTAHGELPASDTTADGFALDRKVSMTLSIEALQSVASNP